MSEKLYLEVEMEELRKIADKKLNADAGLEIFSIEHNGARYWVKRGRPTGSNTLQRIGYTISKISIMAPVEKKSSREAMKFEADKLELLAKSGVHVPSVAARGEDYFVMSDRGESLADILKRSDSRETATILEKAAAELGRMHALGFYHGASQIRNFTIDKDGSVSIIDFEESFPENIDIKTLQFRDLFLMIYSLHRQKTKTDYKKMIETYMIESGNGVFREEFKKLYRKVSIPAALLRKESIRKKLGSDADILHRLFESISGL